jgi:hypothetical protein
MSDTEQLATPGGPSVLMSLEELQFLKESRNYLRSKVTRKCYVGDQSAETFTNPQRRDEVSELKDLRSKLDFANDKVSKGFWIHEKRDEKLQRELEDCDTYDARIVQSIRLLEAGLQSAAHPAGPADVHNNAYRASNQLKLPQLPLPVYSHAKGESLDKFLRKFENIMEKYNLTSYEKYVFLEKQLTKEPLTLISSLEGAQQSYEAAKELLTKAFASPVTRKFEVVQRMAELNLTENGDPYSFISEMRIVTESLSTLNIDVNAILQ